VLSKTNGKHLSIGVDLDVSDKVLTIVASSVKKLNNALWKSM
jgi:hypothetical protein